MRPRLSGCPVLSEHRFEATCALSISMTLVWSKTESTPDRPKVQVRRHPEKTVLYQLVRDHAETLFAEARSRSATGSGYPRHVENEFRRYLECGGLG